MEQIQNEEKLYVQTNGVDPEVQQLAEQAFKKGLTATILSQFPVASIIAIFMGSKGCKLVAETRELANARGVKGGGKYIAANVLSKVGKFAGIGYTIFWGIYGAFISLYALIMMSAALFNWY